VSAGPSLYRRHRPRTFADVVGQEHVVRTLRNAVEQGKVHHAYLFVGSRGTGKTSMAKILAACLNCEHGPTVEPCGRCESCVAIASATSLDVIEMDAASNNSVDDIRDLRESVAYAPVSGPPQGLHPRRGAHALAAGLERVPQDARGAAAAHDLRARDDRGAEGPADGRRPLPPLRLRPSDRRAARRRDLARGREEGIDIGPGRGRASSPATRPARSATRSGTLEQLVTYSGREVATVDVLAVLGVADADLLFGAMDAIGRATTRAPRLHAAARPGLERARPRPGHARPRGLTRASCLVVQTLEEVRPELHVTPDRDAPPRGAEHADRRATSCGSSSCSPTR
jgi:DNA polymerase-3 subunit gamma/tau